MKGTITIPLGFNSSCINVVACYNPSQLTIRRDCGLFSTYFSNVKYSKHDQQICTFKTDTLKLGRRNQIYIGIQNEISWFLHRLGTILLQRKCSFHPSRGAMIWRQSHHISYSYSGSGNRLYRSISIYLYAQNERPSKN